MNSYQSIQFCEDCENKLYHFVDNETLVFICRVCGKKEDIDNDSLCVLNLEYNTEGTRPFEYIVNKYTKHDPTLPHISVPCPNGECKTNDKQKDKECFTDAVYLRYDDVNMKHLYMCTTCDTTWKTNDKNKN